MTTAQHFVNVTSPKTLSILERARSVISKKYVTLWLLTSFFVVKDAFPKSFLVFSGPSGAGKSTLLKRLFNDFPTTFGFSVSRKTLKGYYFTYFV